jgi:hypothetical protein
MPGDQAPRCFVSAPAEIPVGPLISALRARGWEAYLLTDVAPLGVPVTEAVLQAIRRADAVIAVVPSGPTAVNVAVEAGMALALGKRLLVIAAPNADLPTDLRAIANIRAEPDNLEAINYALGLLERDSVQLTEQLTGSGHPIGPESERLLADFDAIESVSGADAERLLIHAIEASGAAVVAAAGRDRGFDLGVWSDDLDTIGANPLLIEIKSRLTTQSVRQATDALHRSPSARLALVVYIEQGDVGAVAGLRSPILAVSLRQLLAELGQQSFAEIVRDLRNRHAHGTETS